MEIKKILPYQPQKRFDKKQRLIFAILKMAQKSGNTKIIKALETHREETKNHSLNLDKLYNDLYIFPFHHENDAN